MIAICLTVVACTALICATFVKVGRRSQTDLQVVAGAVSTISSEAIASVERANHERSLEAAQLTDKLGELVGMYHWSSRANGAQQPFPAAEDALSHSASHLTLDDDMELEDDGDLTDEAIALADAAADAFHLGAQAELEMTEMNSAITDAMAAAVTATGDDVA